MPDNKGIDKEKILLRLFSAQSAMFAFSVVARLKEFLEKMLGLIPGVSFREVCIFDSNDIGNQIKSKSLGKFKASTLLSNNNECIQLINEFKKKFQIYPIKTASYFYGFIAVEICDVDVFSDFDSILSNFAITISIILENKQQKNELEEINNNLEIIVNERTQALNAVNQQLRIILTKVIQTLSITVELRDPYTSGHQYRVAVLSQAIARKLGMPEEQVNKIYLGALIHDVGKMQVPIEILTFPGVLSKMQWDYIKIHPEAGKKIIDPIGFDETITDIVLHHHERLDGSGYPHGLKKDQIPISTRIVSVADLFEAMSSHRPYRPKKLMKETLEELRKYSNILYDKQVVDICIQLMIDEHFELPKYGSFFQY
jgi:putative nucleotidyltransferase with HDIG domain